MAPRWLQDGPPRHQKYSQSVIPSSNYKVFVFSAKMSQVGPSWPQLGPKLGPSWPKLAPSWAQVGPKLAQVGPKLAQVGPKLAHNGFKKSHQINHAKKFASTPPTVAGMLLASWGEGLHRPRLWRALKVISNAMHHGMMRRISTCLRPSRHRAHQAPSTKHSKVDHET